MTISQARQLAVRILAGLCIAILLIVPFHAFLTVWMSSNFGHYTTLRLWKEVLLGLATVIAASLLLGNKELRTKFAGDNLFRLIGLYALLVLLSGVLAYAFHRVSVVGAADGALLDLRFLLFFVVTWVLTKHSSIIFMNWRKILVGPALLVVAFGLLQKFIWPFDFLKHFGYGPHTIDPYETVDQKHAYIRLQSTLRGANPLGAYLVVVLTAMATLVTRVKARVRDHWWLLWVAVGLTTLVVLFYTYSRSGWAAAVLSVAILTALGMRNRRYLWRPAAIFVAVVVLAGAGTLFALRDNDRVQNIFFHTDEHSTSSESSNYGHLAALKDSARDILHQPFGGGTGTAGPASVHNELGPTRIAENYYLQIAQETGIIGLALFVAILVIVALRLWRREYDSLARVLLASLIGISIIGLLSHVWTDDTLAYIWWGFAGVAIARLKPKPKHETAK